jgi:peptidoglycan/xylan/chitin deacetylase (PgdA/CDA1 family)
MNRRRVLRTAHRRGAADARSFVEKSKVPSGTPLGDFGAGGPGEAALRRGLHALRIPPILVLAGSRLVPPAGRRRALAAIERYAYWHGARAHLDRERWRRLTRGTAILMYHAVGRPGEPASRFVVPARRLEQQLRWLVRNRRPVLTLEQLAELRRVQVAPPPGAVVITLGDAFVDTLELAAPVLRRLGLPATVFVVSGRVGQVADWNGAAELSGRPLLDWDGLKRLRPNGVSIGAHTRTHPRLPELSAGQASAEVEASRSELEAKLEETIRTFAYPYGEESDGVVAAVERAGFDVACGIECGLNYPDTPALRLRRVPVHGTLSMLGFALGVRFGDPGLLAGAAGRLLRRGRWE